MQAGVSVLVLDREEFPEPSSARDGSPRRWSWTLNLDVESYPHRFNTFNGIVCAPQVAEVHASDACSTRSAASSSTTICCAAAAPGSAPTTCAASSAFRTASSWTAPTDRNISWGPAAPGCPVYRTFFRDANPRARELQAATYEHEFAHRCRDERCHLWFFEKGLPGYAWYVPKANGYLNCGIGGMAEKLKARGGRRQAALEPLHRGPCTPRARQRRRACPEGIQLLSARWRRCGAGRETRSSPGTRPASRPGTSVKGSARRFQAAIAPRNRDRRGHGVPSRRPPRVQLGHRPRAANCSSGAFAGSRLRLPETRPPVREAVGL